jgi:RNA polymerase sigma factor (sigma-70 family)
MLADHHRESFESFFNVASPKLLRAFVAAYGTDRGGDAAAEAMAYAWEHWRRVRIMENPVGYLYRVGQSRSRRARRASNALKWEPVASTNDRDVEPGLPAALASLSEPQRVAVVLVHGYAWTLREVSELTGVSVSTVQTHVERGLAKLRGALEVVEDG